MPVVFQQLLSPMKHLLQDEELRLLRFKAEAAIAKAQAVVSDSRKMRKKRKIEKALESESFHFLMKAVLDERKSIPQSGSAGLIR